MRTAFAASLSSLVTLAGLALGQNPVKTPDSAPVKVVAPASKPADEGKTPVLTGSSVIPSTCASGACNDGGPCGPDGCMWGTVDYLLWWTRPDRVPPLVTSGTTASRGIIGQPGTTTIIGDSGLGGLPQSGVKFTAGFWCDEDHLVGLEGSYFVLDQASANYANGGTSVAGGTVIARPFFNVSTGANDSELIAFPGVIGGNVVVNSTTRMDGAELNALQNLCCGPDYRIDFLIGFRYFEVDEGLNITENLVVDNTFAVGPGDSIVVSDQFGTKNRFYAMQIGLQGEKRWDDFFVGGFAKFAIGTNHETVIINGTTAFTPPGGPTSLQTGGILALPTNIGRFHHDQFAVLPEFNIRAGYQVTDALRVYLGYNVLYLSDVARPGAQIDPVINATQIPNSGGPGALVGAPRPFFGFVNKDIWVTGFNFGMELRF
jgi:hypothetical protein